MALELALGVKEESGPRALFHTRVMVFDQKVKKPCDLLGHAETFWDKALSQDPKGT